MKIIKAVIAYLGKKDKYGNIIENIKTNSTKLIVSENFDTSKMIGYIGKRKIKVKDNKVYAEIVINDDIDILNKIFRIVGKIEESTCNKKPKIRRLEDVEVIGVSLIPTINDIYEEKDNK